MNPLARSELQDVGGDLVFRIENDLAEIIGRHAHDLCPHLAIFNEQARLKVVAAAHPLIVARPLGGRALVAFVSR